MVVRLVRIGKELGDPPGRPDVEYRDIGVFVRCQQQPDGLPGAVGPIWPIGGASGAR
jgi:hypothetical protein